MRKKLVAGNWKMNGSLTENEALINSLIHRSARFQSVQVAVIPPYPYLAQAQQLLHSSTIVWGAQDVSLETGYGAFTGEVNAGMLKDFGCEYVIVGHSERRQRHHETDQQVARKAKIAVDNHLKPIVCVGETLAEREKGETLSVLSRQIDAVLNTLAIEQLQQVVLAYEPIWAIGTGKSATVQQVQEVHQTLRQRVESLDWVSAQELNILYGGSVKPSNALELMSLPDVDGALVGGASLVAEDFIAIIEAAA
ncbi:MAG: triose-phosphate isomerase [Ferrovum sp. 37-45-19]|jgi:triosephosphate isomerase|uniref:triose-phosphate isomerase n=1 Tax=Ferrovum sp. JA12 TaxID=1356299 RepID=UPI000702E0D1|nr:triose-phosphate isomerase [Ferrovum sp. JA12]OYV79676.1 MAG: triose-phosphate isomerase [Ferrovum sp. 21-44-67]OYV94342.1 MAG: triose-phosphate isomerase [Ferrovum sp. 37-45-19]OZB32356.1 MAG: triose-phosphate isomerase [Ferrovum sp. 34-44-207]HQT80599.1 triose-phosphate isomerase [Ferrovaceae bacterium]KRH79688.1 triosephosphate isomerase [Ferrovum sp. JA12]